MKKMQKYTIAFLVGLCSFLMAGSVRAAATASNFDIVCSPESIEKNNTSTCHLVAVVSGETGIFGVATKISTMNHLTLFTGDGTTGVHGGNDYITAEYYTNGGESKIVPGYKCATTGEKGCAFFMSNSSTNAILPSTGNTITGLKKGNNEYNGYTDIGYFTVTLDETATKQDCGRLCVTVQFAETKAAFTSEQGPSADSGSKEACDEITPILAGEVASVEETPETGNFASYAVLAAGAFIAISAIAIAKKHNKFYRV